MFRFAPTLVRVCLAGMPVALAFAGQPESLAPAGSPQQAVTPPAAAASLPAVAAKPAIPPPPTDALIGRPPPPVRVAKWVKGEPLAGFEKGKVYVFDLWATWCGPCNAAIPHLTRLAQNYKGKVEVVGISILERQKDATDTAYIDVVDAFVKKRGDRMDYRVAADTVDKQMASTWFKPAGTAGIPTAWIIDPKGLVAWIGIGEPKEVERIVGEVLAGTFDTKKEAARQQAAEDDAKRRSVMDIAAAKEMQKKQSDIYAKYPGYREAMDRGDQAAALESLNAAFKADPACESMGAYQWKFFILLERNKPEEVNRYAEELLERFPKNGNVVSYVSAAMFSGESEPRYDKQLVLRACKLADELSKPGSRFASYAKYHLGWAFYHAGERERAIETMQAALASVRKLKATIDFGDLETECDDALKEFRKTAKQDL